MSMQVPTPIESAILIMAATWHGRHAKAWTTYRFLVVSGVCSPAFRLSSAIMRITAHWVRPAHFVSPSPLVRRSTECVGGFAFIRGSTALSRMMYRTAIVLVVCHITESNHHHPVTGSPGQDRAGTISVRGREGKVGIVPHFYRSVVFCTRTATASV